MRAIKAVRPGRELSVVGRVIESYAKRFGYGVVREYTGHGIGRSFHGGLVVLHYDDPGCTSRWSRDDVHDRADDHRWGRARYEKWDDDWTVVTRDGSRTAQFEHTVSSRPDGAEILTLP